MCYHAGFCHSSSKYACTSSGTAEPVNCGALGPRPLGGGGGWSCHKHAPSNVCCYAECDCCLSDDTSVRMEICRKNRVYLAIRHSRSVVRNDTGRSAPVTSCQTSVNYADKSPVKLRLLNNLSITVFFTLSAIESQLNYSYNCIKLNPT